MTASLSWEANDFFFSLASIFLTKSMSIGLFVGDGNSAGVRLISLEVWISSEEAVPNFLSFLLSDRLHRSQKYRMLIMAVMMIRMLSIMMMMVNCFAALFIPLDS